MSGDKSIKKSCEFKKEAYRDGMKRKGDKIGMEYIHEAWLMNRFEHTAPSHNPYIVA